MYRPNPLLRYARGAGERIALHVARFKASYTSGALVLVLVAIALFISARPPDGFPAGHILTVENGAALSDIAATLAAQNAISSPFLFSAFVRFLAGETSLQAGRYVFDEPQNLFDIAYAIITGTSGIPPVRITFSEGLSVREMSEHIAYLMPEFDATTFENQARGFEGYLFPDTYLFPQGASADEVIARMRENFEAKIKLLEADIAASGHTRSDIVIMAALLEKETRTLSDKRIVAGILWKRVSISMPLQVDAVFGYIRGTDTYHPILEDLKIDSPYNTYRYAGLPPGPIANPGLESLLAAVHPTETDYLYYLTGRDGVMRYAKTFEEHKRNRARYLD